MPKILVTGGGGQLGREFGQLLDLREPKIESLVLNSSECDITNADQVNAVLCAFQPDVVINCAAMTAVDACEEQVDRAYLINALAVRNLVRGSELVGSQLVNISTDYVFDGRSPRPYMEWDQTNPQSVYGKSKRGGELELRPRDLCVRTAWLVGRYGANMAKTVMRLHRSNPTLRFVNDQIGSPTIASDLAEKVVELVLLRQSGMVHVTNSGSGSWFDFAQAVVRSMGGDPASVEPISSTELPGDRRAPRPANSVLDNAVLRLGGLGELRHWQDGTEELIGTLLASNGS